VGVEPTTNGLKGRCSTTELRPYMVMHSNVWGNYRDTVLDSIAVLLRTASKNATAGELRGNPRACYRSIM
jgi:hypothetical protein